MPSAETENETETTGRPAPVAHRRLLAKVRAALTDPVLRALITSTAVSRIGRGVFFTVTVLYFTQIIGLSGGQAALVLTVSSGAGVLASLLGGSLADRISARRLSAVCEVLSGIFLVLYAFASDFVSAMVIAVIAGVFESLSHTSRSAIIARGFAAEHRVRARAVLRTVTNVSIALGSALAALALALGTAEAYRTVIVIAGLVCVAGAVPLLRLPARVDAPPRERVQVTTKTGTLDVEATADAARAHRRQWRSRSPWRDPRYLLLTALTALFGMQFGVAELGVPLWVSEHTDAPDVLVSVLFIINTGLVVAFQVPLSRNTHDVRVAGRGMVIAGVLMTLACLVYASAADAPVVLAIVVLVVAMVLHSFAEVISQAGGWGLSFELADPARAGAYQGVFGMGFGLGGLAAPVVVNATAISHGLAGWAVLGGVFLLAALGVAAIAFRAAGRGAKSL